jgi:beta-carotene 15,15'-dioxygenase
VAGGSNPSDPIRSLHLVVALGVTLIAVAASVAGWSPSPIAALAIGVGALMFGMPHGALDVAIGPQLLHWAAFFPLYGLVAGLTVALWFVTPLLSLGLFLLLSWYHFGSGNVSGFGLIRALRFCRGIATGGFVLGLPMVFHADVVSPIFTDLMIDRTAFDPGRVRIWGVAMLMLAVPSAIVIVCAHISRRDWVGATEIVLLSMLGIVASPLISFAIYFACWHSPRHMLEVRAGKRATIPTVVATLFTVGVAAAVWVLVRPSIATATQVVFIGLASLTVPHLAVTESIRRKHHRKHSE